MQHNHTGATGGQSLEVTEMALLLMAQIAQGWVLGGQHVVLCMV